MAHTVKNLPEMQNTWVRSLGQEDPEESKLLHFVRFLEKSLWKSPDLTPPPVNQSEPLASPGKFESSPGKENQSELNT